MRFQSKVEQDGLRHVASVAVVWNYSLLMGLRRDTNGWTLPGGHIDQGENKFQGMSRELWEEAGIETDPSDIKLLGTEKILGRTGNPIWVSAFRLDTYRRFPTTENDPDNEISRWEWVRFDRFPLPFQLQPDNLHSKQNLVLKYMGLQSW